MAILTMYKKKNESDQSIAKDYKGDSFEKRKMLILCIVLQIMGLW